MRFLIGSGKLSWPPSERRSDRYGSVILFDGDKPKLSLDEALCLAGASGKLVGVVAVPVRSDHCGDVFRGIYPSLPAAGEEVILGEGKLFFVLQGGKTPLSPHRAMDEEAMLEGFRKAGVTVVREEEDVPEHHLVGVEPADGRKTDWLDPRGLYRLHSSIVKLYFEAS